MRKINRLDLPDKIKTKLCEIQDRANHTPGKTPAQLWESESRLKTIKKVRKKLNEMAGERERCMYCSDSKGTDIEHFWPKSAYPSRMFLWPNFLLCCRDCNSYKSNEFPLDENKNPLLIDPSAENPWDFLEFDPVTGNFTGLYEGNEAHGDWNLKGETTVKTLGLDRRESVAAGHRKSYRRLKCAFEAAIATPFSFDALKQQLKDADDHDLLSWCLKGSGSKEPPFKNLKDSNPTLWNDLLTLVP